MKLADGGDSAETPDCHAAAEIVRYEDHPAKIHQAPNSSIALIKSLIEFRADYLQGPSQLRQESAPHYPN